MTANRFAVPLSELETVRVTCTEQVQEQAQPRVPEPTWNLPPFLDSGAPGDDGD